MNVRFTIPLGRIRLAGGIFAVLTVISACGQIGPLYLPDQADTSSEQNQAPERDDAQKDSEEK